MTVQKKLDGKLDMDAAIALHADLLKDLEAGQDVDIDCGTVSMCGAAAAQVLVSLSKTLQFSSHSLTLSRMSDAMRGDLKTLGLGAFFNGGQDV